MVIVSLVPGGAKSCQLTTAFLFKQLEDRHARLPSEQGTGSSRVLPWSLRFFARSAWSQVRLDRISGRRSRARHLVPSERQAESKG